MTLKMFNNHPSAASGRIVRSPFIGMLLLGFGLLLSFFQPAVAGPGRPGVTATITILKDSSVAGSGNPDIIQVTLSPAPNPGDQLQFNISTSSYTPQATTDPTTGVITLPFSSSIVGPAIVDVVDLVTGQDLGSVTVFFMAVPDPPDPSRSYFTVIQNPAAADGTSEDIVKAFIFDDHGNPIPNESIQWTIQSGVATFASNPNAVTSPYGSAAAGTSTIGLVSTTVGNVNVQALVGGVGGFQLQDKSTPRNDYLPVQFTIPPPSVALSYILATTPTTAADGTSKDVVEAVVNNTAGQPVPDGTSVTFTIQSGTATMTATGVTVGGVAYAYFTSSTPGAVVVQAQINTPTGPAYLNDQANPANNYTTVYFTTPPPVVNTSYILATTPTTAADGTSKDVVEAVVNNALGPVPDGTVVTFTYMNGTATMTTTGVTVGGIAYAYFTSTVVGSVQVQAQITTGSGPAYLNDQANPANNYTTVYFTQPPPVVTLSYIVATVPSNAADGSSQDVVEAVVNNALGPVPDGTVVTFSIQSGTANMTISGTTVGGVAYAYFTSLVVGSVQWSRRRLPALPVLYISTIRLTPQIIM